MTLPPLPEPHLLVFDAAQGAEPVAWIAPTSLDWHSVESERIVKVTQRAQPQRGFTTPLYAAPPAAQPAVGWIACSERMPPNDAEPVLAIIAPRRRYYLLAGDVMNRSYATSRVTHWMPLPKPPETLLDVAHRLIEAEAERISARAKLERDKGSEQ